MTFYRDRADGPIHTVEFTGIECGKSVGRVSPIYPKSQPSSQRIDEQAVTHPIEEAIRLAEGTLSVT